MSAPFRKLPDLADLRLGGRAVAANDEFFAPKENLLKPNPAEFKPHEYTDRGKWMDGWETRRRRTPGHDWVVVRLGARGVVRGLVVDTAHFLGNHPQAAWVDAADLAEEPGADGWDAVAWTSIAPRTPLEPGSANEIPVDDPWPCTHVRLAIDPDGGVARLRVHGVAVPALGDVDGPVDLAAIPSGALALACSDEFFSAPLNLLRPDRSAGMWDGWETRRRRGPGHDWVVIRLGARATVERIEIDTAHFRGNFPDSARVEIADRPGDGALRPEAAPLPAEDAWVEVVPRTPLGADQVHAFDVAPAAATHVRLSIHPDGGVARLRVIGTPLP